MISNIAQHASTLVRTGLLLAVVLAVSGCGGPTAGEELSPAPESPTQSATEAPTAEGGNTAAADPSAEETTLGNENTATAEPSTTMGESPASTPVPPPTPGTINETVASRPLKTADPVGMKETATFDQEVYAEIVKIQTIEDTEAGMPNEVPGPALAITVRLTNGTSSAVPLDSVVVEVMDSLEAPGGRMTGNPYDPLSGSLAVGKSVSGTYVYTVGKDKRNPVSIVVTLAADQPMVLFRGPVG